MRKEDMILMRRQGVICHKKPTNQPTICSLQINDHHRIIVTILVLICNFHRLGPFQTYQKQMVST